MKSTTGGNMFPYFKSPRDSMGRRREFPARPLTGDAEVATQLLRAQAPARVRTPRGIRENTDWVRHCQRHLIHIIIGFLGCRSHIEACLGRIMQLVEYLVLAGLPSKALYFASWMHPMTRNTHAHAGLVSTLLTNGRPYELNLNPELRVHFHRLVCAAFGFPDPVGPQGCRVIYAAWGSAKEANAAEIQEICEAADQRFRETPRRLNGHGDLLTLLADLNFPVLVRPDSQGRPTDTNVARHGLRAPRLRQTVVIASRDGKRVIVLKGPAAHYDYQAAALDAEISWRKAAVAAMRCDRRPVHRNFLVLLEERIKAQRGLCPESAGPRVTAAHFEDLNPAFQFDPVADYVMPVPADYFATLPPLDRWSEQGFPFLDAFWPDPPGQPGPEDVEADLQFELERADEGTAAPDEPRPTPSSPPASPPPAPPVLALDLDAERARRHRRKLALATSLAVAQHHELTRSMNAPNFPSLT